MVLGRWKVLRKIKARNWPKKKKSDFLTLLEMNARRVKMKLRKLE